MARKKTDESLRNIKSRLSERLREVRVDLFGEHGGPEMARRLNLATRSWYNYETGVTVPAETLLAFLGHTGVVPDWLLTGEGPKYLRAKSEAESAAPGPLGLIRRALEMLERESNGGDGSPNGLAAVDPIDPGMVCLIPVNGLAKEEAEGCIPADRRWLPNPDETVGVRVPDGAMHPMLPAGSLAAIDRTVTDPHLLQGGVVAAVHGGASLVRWLDVAGKHLILRPNQPSREHPLISMALDEVPADLIVGRVVWSWNRFVPN